MSANGRVLIEHGFEMAWRREVLARFGVAGGRQSIDAITVAWALRDGASIVQESLEVKIGRNLLLDEAGLVYSRSVERGVKLLEDAGLLEVERPGRTKPHIYRLRLPATEPPDDF